ncbi:hypothetical protein Tco_1257665 [Tanacetum coccineum]
MIRKCNQCLSSTLKSNEPTIQVALDALKLTPFYNAFEVSADVPEIYMQEFWATVTRHHYSLWFMLNGKSHTVNVDNFRDMLKISLKLPGQKFEEPPFEEEIFPLIGNLGHTGNIKYLTNQAKLESETYKTYHAYAIGEKTPKPKKKKADSESSPKEKPAQTSKAKRLKTSSKATQSTKEKKPATKSKEKGLTVLSEVALTEDEQMKLATKRSRIQTHSSHASGSGAGDKPKVPDVPEYNSDSEEESWTFSDYNDDDDVNEESDAHDDSDENETDDEDLNLNRERIDAGMTEAHATKDTKDAYVNPTAVTPVVQQQSSSASDLVSTFINPATVEGIDSVLYQNSQSDTRVDIPVTTASETPSSDTTTLQPSTLNIHSLQTPVTTTSTTFPTTKLLEIPNFGSLFGFEHRVSSSEIELSKLKQISFIPDIVDNYLASKMKEAVDVAVAKIKQA